MRAFTHAATGVFIAASVVLIARPSPLGAALLLIGGLLGSVLPDIDHPKSWLGRRIPFISIPLSALVGHRGVTHSLIALAFTLICGFGGLTYWGLSLGAWELSVVGLSLGYASHLLGDWASNSGIPLLWPSLRRYKSPVTFFTGSMEEKAIAFSLWGCSAYVMFHAIYPLNA